jgi:hypothetical protein
MANHLTHHAARAAAVVALLALAAAGCADSDTDTDAGSDAGGSPSSERRAGPGDQPGAESPGEPSPTGSGATPPGDSPDPDPGETPEQDGAPWCATDALSVSLTPLSPGAGNRYAALILTNTSDTACRTQGWPGLQLVTADGDTIPTTTVRDDSADAAQLTVQPGDSVHARLHWTVVPGGEDPADGCGPEPASLRVIPPDEESAASAEWEMGEVCGGGRIEALPLAEGEGEGTG